MGSVRTILASLFTALGGFFLLALTAGVGFILYLATAPDSASAPADADAVAERPLMRPQPVASHPSNVIRIASASLVEPPDASPRLSDRGGRVRELQKALTRARCYNGPISGIWSEASKDAMRGFTKTVNAELPVNTPDESLVALIESNETAKCMPGRAIETGALAPSLPAFTRVADAKNSTSTSAAAPNPNGNDHVAAEPTFLNRAWAPSEMLVPASVTVPPKPATDAVQSNAAVVTATNEVSATEDADVSKPSAAIHFEGGKPLATAQPVDSPPVAAELAPESHAAPPAKPKKSKTARRRPAKDDDVETSISKGFDTLQRSFSSMF